MATRGRPARRKGHQAEREIANELRDLYPNARRNLEYQEGTGEDLERTPGIRIQSKCGKSYTSFTKIEEIKNPTGVHILVSKADRKPKMMAMKWNDWLGIMETWQEKTGLKFKDIVESYNAKKKTR